MPKPYHIGSNGLDTEKAITEISAKDFYKLSQIMTRPEADLFFELQEAIQSKKSTEKTLLSDYKSERKHHGK